MIVLILPAEPEEAWLTLNAAAWAAHADMIAAIYPDCWLYPAVQFGCN